ncbi:MAG: VOC family protein [Pseudomonadales bacterium]
MIRGLHHVGIVTSDLEKAKHFYCGVFGFEVYSESEWRADNAMFNTIIAMGGSAARFCMLKGPNTYLELFEFISPGSSVDPARLQPSDHGFRHLMFEVDDVLETWSKVKEYGGIVMNPPVDVPGGPCVTYCRDPFGNLIELARPAGRMPSLEDL